MKAEIMYSGVGVKTISRTNEGVLFGGLIGTFLGWIFERPLEGALVGSLIGATVGGAIGYAEERSDINSKSIESKVGVCVHT